MSDFQEQWKEKSLRNIGEKGNQIVIFKQTGWNIFIFIVSRNHTNRAGIYFLSLSPSMLAAVWLWITEHLGWEGPLGSHQAQPIPITWPALNSDKDAKGLISLVHWKLPSRGISESSWIPLPASNHPHGENCFPDLQSGVLLLQLVCFPHMAQTQLISLPRQVSDAQGWGHPPCPPAALLLTGVRGWALAAKICPVGWRWKRYLAPSSPLSKRRICLIRTNMQRRSSSSSSEPNHSYAPLQLNTSEDTGSHLQQNLHGPQWG